MYLRSLFGQEGKSEMRSSPLERLRKWVSVLYRSLGPEFRLVTPRSSRKMVLILMSGRTLAYTRVNFYTPDDKLVAFGSHTKYMGSAKATTSFTADGKTEKPVEEKSKL
jgi:hypothetical protein